MKANHCRECGSNEIIIYLQSGPLAEDFGYYVQCLICGCKTAVYPKQNKAIKAWNEGDIIRGLV